MGSVQDAPQAKKKYNDIGNNQNYGQGYDYNSNLIGQANFRIFVDFLITEEALIVEKVALEVLMIVEDIGTITNHNVSYAVG